MGRRMIDVTKLPKRTFYYRDEGIHREGIELTPEGVVYFQDDTVPNVGGASAPYSVEEFLAEPGNGMVSADHPVVREVVELLTRATC